MIIIGRIALVGLMLLVTGCDGDQDKTPKEKSQEVTKSKEDTALSQTSYHDYFKEFLPELAREFREYNKTDPEVARMSDFDVLKTLFPQIEREGDYPSLDDAKKRFQELARNERPYAYKFNPPSVDEEK